jgi:hypothetical protein
MPKRGSKFIAGRPLEEVLEFLCHQAELKERQEDQRFGRFDFRLTFGRSRSAAPHRSATGSF